MARTCAPQQHYLVRLPKCSTQFVRLLNITHLSTLLQESYDEHSQGGFS
jgi:hypothetical protein